MEEGILLDCMYKILQSLPYIFISKIVHTEGVCTCSFPTWQLYSAPDKSVKQEIQFKWPNK